MGRRMCRRPGRRRLNHQVRGRAIFDQIVHLWGMDAMERTGQALLASLQVLQSLIQAGVAGKHWFVTKGAQAVTADDKISPWQTCLGIGADTPG